MSDDVEGTVLVQRYALVRQLGAGGMGRVYLADDTMLNRKVAIKQILTQATITDGSGAARAMREARVAARLDNPYAVPVYDVFTIEGAPYMVMGYVEGESLAERLDREHHVPLRETGRLIGQTASALAAAHELEIVHRDVKPANILITTRGTAKLADFGIARASSDPSMTSTGMVIGSVAYMAPEVAQGDPATGASDVFSLGATFFSALEGKAPFDGESSATILLKLVSEPAPRSVAAGPLSGLLCAMLEKEPGNRPSAQQVEDALLNHAPLDRWRRFERPGIVPGPQPGVVGPRPSGPPLPPPAGPPVGLAGQRSPATVQPSTTPPPRPTRPAGGTVGGAPRPPLPPPGSRPSAPPVRPHVSGPHQSGPHQSGPHQSGPHASGRVSGPGPAHTSGPAPHVSGPAPQVSGPRPSAHTSGQRPAAGPAPRDRSADVLKGILAGAIALIVVLVIVALVLK